MSSWEDRVHEHPLGSFLKDWRAGLSQISLPDQPTARDSYEYMEHVAGLVSSKTERVAAIEVTRGMLDDLAAAISRTTLHMNSAWVPGENDGDMDDQTQTVVESLARWPIATSPHGLVDAYEAAAGRLSQTVDRVLNDVSAERDATLSVLKSLQKEQDLLGVQIAEQQTATTNAVAMFTSSSDKAIASARELWDAEDQRQREQGEGHLVKLKELEHEAQGLVHSGTGAVVATDYGKYARNKTIAAWICDVAAALIGAAGVGAILLHLYRSEAELADGVGLSLTRLAASLGTLGIAALVGRRGQQHHQEARDAKRADLAIRRVGPFTESLPADVREQVRVDLTDRIFIRGELGEPPAIQADHEGTLWSRVINRRTEIAAE